MGISDYLNLSDLHYADDDAQDIYNRLVSAGWVPAEITLLIDSQATKTAIQNAIGNVTAQVPQSQDLFLFFFSGKGGQGTDSTPPYESDNLDEYLYPYDSLTDSFNNDIMDDQLNTLLNAIVATKVVIIDSPCSGGFVNDLSKNGVVILTACGENGTNSEFPAAQNSLFSYYVDKALRGYADTNFNGVSAEEVYAYAAPLVRTYTNNLQNPQLSDGVAGDVLLTSYLPLPTPTPAVPLGEAVDNLALSWTTGGNANWFGQTEITYFGGDAAQSGAITHNQSTWLQTTVSGPGSLSFYWAVSSEAGYDSLRFYIDDVQQTSTSGNVSWQPVGYSILGSGTHTLKWVYTKDGSVSVGVDCGWLDKVEFTAGSLGLQTASRNATGTELRSPAVRAALPVSALKAASLTASPASLPPDQNVESVFVTLYFPREAPASYQPFDTIIKLNGHEIGRISNAVPRGHYTFEVDPSFLNYSEVGIADNTIVLDVEGMNRGYYLPLESYTIDISFKQYARIVCAASQTEADQIVQNLGSAMDQEADFAIYTQDIAFSDTQPQAGDRVRIQATIHNLGGLDLGGLPIQFLDGTTEIDSWDISYIAPHGTETVAVWWTATGGSHNITVKLNVDHQLPEGDYTNNEAVKTIVVVAPDTTPPELSNPYPADGSTITSVTPLISADLADPGSGINTTAVTISIDGTNVTQNASVISSQVWYTPGQPLSGGPHNVSVYAEDNRGFGNTLNWSFIVAVGKQPPTASFSHSPEAPLVNQNITFDASSSTDPDGQIVSYMWDFGDGGNATGQVVQHFYTTVGGNYTITLTVTDNDGLTSNDTAEVTVSAASEVTSVSGITREVNGNILPGVSITLDGIATVVSNQSGQYQIMASSTGNHTVVAHKYGFRDRTLTINIQGLGPDYAVTCNFQGQHGLIPNAPDIWYALDCVNLWLYPPNPNTGLDIWTALDVINAWLYPVQ